MKVCFRVLGLTLGCAVAQMEMQRTNKVRDAALARAEKLEKQKAEVEAARDKLKCGSVPCPEVPGLRSMS